MKNPSGKERSAFGEAVIRLVKDQKSFRHGNFALTGYWLEALQAIIDQFLECGWMATQICNGGRRHSLFPKRQKTLGNWSWITGD